MHEIACRGPQGTVTVKADSLPFERLPGQSNLFLQYLKNPESLKRYYPNAINSRIDISDRIRDVLENYSADRDALCDALAATNRNFGAFPKTFENIDLLRQPDTIAIVTGQQAGLFTGPLYTIYKALSAVRMAECLRLSGVNAVPVFWVATEDHDFEEVSRASFIDKYGSLSAVKAEPAHCHENLPVGHIRLDESIGQTLDELFRQLPATEFTVSLKDLLNSTWYSGRYFGDAFGEMLTRLLGNYGLILLCPMNSELKRLAAPIYVKAIEKSSEIVEALVKRSSQLTAEGFPAQVHITEDYFPLFWQANDDTRNALKRSSDDTFRTKDGLKEFTLQELANLAASEPQRFSPSVVLRSVVQDYILPTLVYFGGAAEIAYFAQSSEVYRVLERPVTPIFHRQSFTFIEPRHSRTMRRYGLDFIDLFRGLDALLPEIVEKHLDRETGRLFADVEEKINTELRRLDERLATIDPTLAENLAKRRRKILYHIAALRHKFHRSQIRRDETIRNQIETMFSTLLPNGVLQERVLSIITFYNRYGRHFIDWVYESIDLNDKDHRVVYL
ncbi:MAG: bacillithiol biosynthesis cysteine-adding enzyme BshC [Pyrinomonadaceae bacterium]